MSNTIIHAHPEGFLINEDRGPQIVAVNASMIALVLVSVSLRFYSRSTATVGVKPISKYWWDDWVILAVVPLAILNPILCIAGVHFGNGQHIWNISPQKALVLGKIYFTTILLMKISLTIAKTSALLFYARVFSLARSPSWFRIGIYLAHVINVSWGLSFVLSITFQCNPIAKAWNHTLSGKCSSLTAIFIASAVTCVIMDLYILFLPLPRVWTLQIQRQRRLVLFVIFFCGYSVSLISIGRLIETCLERDALTNDYTYDAVPFQCWAACEAPVTIFSVCIPAMSKLSTRLPRAMASRITSLDFSRPGGVKPRPRSNEASQAQLARTTHRSEDFTSAASTQKNVLLNPSAYETYELDVLGTHSSSSGGYSMGVHNTQGGSSSSETDRQ